VLSGHLGDWELRAISPKMGPPAIGGSLASIAIADETGGASKARREQAAVHKLHARGLFLVRERASGLLEQR